MRTMFGHAGMVKIRNEGGTRRPPTRKWIYEELWENLNHLKIQFRSKFNSIAFGWKKASFKCWAQQFHRCTTISTYYLECSSLVFSICNKFCYIWYVICGGLFYYPLPCQHVFAGSYSKCKRVPINDGQIYVCHNNQVFLWTLFIHAICHRWKWNSRSSGICLR